MGASNRYTISELAEEFGVTTRTIRFYEEKGLLTPLRDGQRRIYRRADRTRLKLILRGRRLGFSLEESRDIIDMYDAVSGSRRQLQALIGKIRDRRDQLERQREDIEASLADLATVERRCFDALDDNAGKAGKGSPNK